MRELSRAGTALALLAMLTCGSGDTTGPLPPAPSDPSVPAPSGPAPAESPAPVGWSIYAVDLTNHFLLFGKYGPRPSPVNQKVMATEVPASASASAGDPPVQCTRPG